MHPKQIAIADFAYHLPADKIAHFPLAERDLSKLLIYSEGKIKEDIYKNIAGHLPDNSLLIFNNTKVIRARMHFAKPTGGTVEFFCLEPYENDHEYALVMIKTKMVLWKCMVRNAGKGKIAVVEKKINVHGIEVILKAEVKDKLSDAYVVEFSWQPSHFNFAEIIEEAGDIPLPPYIKRKPVREDQERYQTIYAAAAGSVAAPTAGLHFTENVFSCLTTSNIKTDFVTLHVGAGTFKPVKATHMADHEMHAEHFEITITTIENVLQQVDAHITAVGTTSVRTLESLYWMGVKTLLQPDGDEEYLSIKQWEVFDFPLADYSADVTTALRSLMRWMKIRGKEKLFSTTQLIISPGYQFKIVNALVTNFHQPYSTLLLLIAAAAGNNWKMIYDYALENNFRFLSYGDGCLIFCGPRPRRGEETAGF